MDKGFASSLKTTDVEWIVNSNAELGVKIGNRFFFLYKARSIQYEEDELLGEEDGKPLLWRTVYKREFGECCHPEYTLKKYTGSDAIPDDFPAAYGSLEDWSVLPSSNQICAGRKL